MNRTLRSSDTIARRITAAEFDTRSRQHNRQGCTRHIRRVQINRPNCPCVRRPRPMCVCVCLFLSLSLSLSLVIHHAATVSVHSRALFRAPCGVHVSKTSFAPEQRPSYASRELMTNETYNNNNNNIYTLDTPTNRTYDVQNDNCRAEIMITKTK
jgi:hypothetical protein